MSSEIDALGRTKTDNVLLFCPACTWRSHVEAQRGVTALRQPVVCSEHTDCYGICPECGRGKLMPESEGLTLRCSCIEGDSTQAAATRGACTVGKIVGLHALGSALAFDGKGDFTVTAGAPRKRRRKADAPRGADDMLDPLLALYEDAVRLAAAKQADYWVGSGSDNTSSSMASHAQAKADLAQHLGKMIVTTLEKAGIRALPPAPDSNTEPDLRVLLTFRRAKARHKMAAALSTAFGFSADLAERRLADAEGALYEALDLTRREED